MEVKNIAKGNFLISQPHLEDPNFKRSVILLLEHNQIESIGCVLNKYTSMEISEIVKKIPEINSKVSIGGPVDQNILLYVHQYGEIIPESRKIQENIFWGGDFSEIKKAIKQKKIKENKIRFFLGYSGWKANQLKQEIKDNSWIVYDGKKDLIFNQEKNLWKKHIKSLDEKHSMWINMPENPNLN